MLRSKKYSCPECNPENTEDGVKLFHVDGDGRKYFFCSKCLGEFKVENETIIQTFKMEKEVEVNLYFGVRLAGKEEPEEIKSESQINISEKMEKDETAPDPETEENNFKIETDNQIDK